MKHVIFLVFAAGTAAAVWGQEPPHSPCAYEGFEKGGVLAEVIASRSARKYSSGDLVLVNRVEGDWSCGYLVQRKGAGPAWVLTKDTRAVPVDPNPKLEAWVGTWAGGEDTVKIRIADAKDRLAVEGSAIWSGPVTAHTGEIEGEASPQGNRLHVTGPAGTEDCQVNMTLIGRYIVASDNNVCGGMNVRFDGIWRRVKP